MWYKNQFATTIARRQGLNLKQWLYAILVYSLLILLLIWIKAVLLPASTYDGHPLRKNSNPVKDALAFSSNHRRSLESLPVVDNNDNLNPYRESTTEEGEENDPLEEDEEAPNDSLDDIVIKYVKKNHLFPHNPNAPTNYSDSMDTYWTIQRKTKWQQLLSKFVIKRLQFKRNGFFVECGAWDGVVLSNTLLLEKDYDWKGLLIEADPAHTPTLKNRNRRAWVADLCLSPLPRPTVVEMTGHNSGVRGKAYIDKEVMQLAPNFKHLVDYQRKFKVQCIPFEMLMDIVDRTEIDYFSLDVEGVELDILKTIPFNKFHIQLISVGVRPWNKKEVQTFLKTVGYEKIHEFTVHSDHMHDDLYELQSNLK